MTVAVTASTGMASLQFSEGQTIHHWSGYGDGHLDVHRILQEISVSSTYAQTRKNICACQVLVIDEIGMISKKVFESVEIICRNIRNSNKLFGGLEVLASGSFVQLSAVPSENDLAEYCFISPVFKATFPHKINLSQVHRQREKQLITAINELCEGYPSPHTERFIRSLKRPIANQDKAVYIFGTNYEVEFYNHMKLDTLHGNPVLYSAADSGKIATLRSCGGTKTLVLKRNAKVIIVRNLYNGLVNGLGATVLNMENKQVIVQIDDDPNLPNRLRGRIFKLGEYTFLVRDVNNEVVSVRKQIPLKLGYAMTVHKAQGKSLQNVIVDSLQFWKPGQLGVAIGRAVSTEGLQVLNYNSHAAGLKHPEVVKDFYMERSKVMKESLSCCTNQEYKGTVDPMEENVRQYHLPPINVPQDHSQYLRDLPKCLFPFEPSDFIQEIIQSIGDFTEEQQDEVQLLKDYGHTECFLKFLHTAFSVVNDIFRMYNVADTQKKCNWCRMCNHLQRFLSSDTFKTQICDAFNTKELHRLHNFTATNLYFELLKLVTKEAADIRRKERVAEFIKDHCEKYTFSDLDKSTLRYIAGAAIHSVLNSLRKVASRQVMNNKYKALLCHRQAQLATKLMGPPDKIQEESVEPESLLKLISKDKGGLLYVNDATFQLFKVLMLKLRKLQNMMTLQTDPDQVFSSTLNALCLDEELLNMFFSLFAKEEEDIDSSTCSCTENPENDSNVVKELIDVELQQSLIMDLFEKIVHYVCRVHLAEQMFKLKDHTCQKRKTFRLRTQVDNLKSKEGKKSLKPPVCYPCGKCGKECIDIMNRANAEFTDFSVLCDFCNKWYHLICEALRGDEECLKEGSAAVYKCHQCTNGQNVQGPQQIQTAHVAEMDEAPETEALHVSARKPEMEKSAAPSKKMKRSTAPRKTSVPRKLLSPVCASTNDSSINEGNTQEMQSNVGTARRSTRKRALKIDPNYVYSQK